ncbi:putative serine/threonine-protein kinase iks1 [Lobaria immixta]|nr:putative serine/threonine-protein kinase iks1 [Lobaria immixta]
MSIVPYATSREIVLRHNDAVVVYDPLSKQLVLRDASSQGKVELADCPYCHRPLRTDDNPHPRDPRTPDPDVAAGFVNPDYFRILRQSLPSSGNSSSPPSPRRRLVQPVRDRNSSSASSPPNVDFMNGSSSPAASPSGISSSAFSPDYFKRFFVEERELGRGGKGVVLLVKHVLDGVTLGHFACKRVPVGDDHEWLEKVLVEVQLLQYLTHQHLVSYRHVWLEDVKLSNFGPSVPCAFILQQFCNAGDLHHYISSSVQSSDSTQQLKERVRRRSKNHPDPPRDLHGRKLQFEEIYSFFKDITSGLNHLHVNGYIHRDLKPSNCLLHDNGKGLRVLVSDFGEVQVESMVRKSTGATGTISYCAPEVLRREYPSGAFGNFTTKSDIFSLGMILYFLSFAQLPYQNADILNEDQEDLNELRGEITSWAGLHEERKLRPDLPEKLYTFLRRLLSLDPVDRPSAEDILLGIKRGSGLDEIASARPPSSGHMYDDLRNSARISPVDSPHTGTPVPHTPVRKMSTGFARPGVPAKLRLPSHQNDRTRSSPMVEDESPRPIGPEASLVLRRQFPSPTKMRDVQQLPAPPSTGPAWHLDLDDPVTRRTLKLVLLLLKVISVNTLCNPMAPSRWVQYSLLILAALDVSLQSAALSFSFVLVIVHLVLLMSLWRSNVLCMSTWAEI